MQCYAPLTLFNANDDMQPFHAHTAQKMPVNFFPHAKSCIFAGRQATHTKKMTHKG